MTADQFKIFILPFITFILGFIVRTWIPTKKERFDIESKRDETSEKFRAEREERGSHFTQALSSMYSLKDQGADEREIMKGYWALRSSGDKYFSTLESIATFISNGKFDRASNESGHYDEIKKNAEKTIPLYYNFINDVAKENNFPLTDELNRETFKNILALLKGSLPPEEYQKILIAWNIS